MTDQTNAMLIAELRAFAAGSESARATLMRDAADALEAAEQERDNWQMSAEEAEHAEKRWKDRAIEAERELQVAEDQANNLAGDLAQAEKERDALAAVVEQARLYCENQGDKFRHHAGRILDMLAASPVDALREVKAKAWDEGHDAGWKDRHQDALAGWMPSDSYESEAVNPYRAREGEAMSAADPRVESRESATTPACAVCHTTGYWVGWLPKAGEYRCINHNKTKEEPHAG